MAQSILRGTRIVDKYRSSLALKDLILVGWFPINQIPISCFSSLGQLSLEFDASAGKIENTIAIIEKGLHDIQGGLSARALFARSQEEKSRFIIIFGAKHGQDKIELRVALLSADCLNLTLISTISNLKEGISSDYSRTYWSSIDQGSSNSRTAQLLLRKPQRAMRLKRSRSFHKTSLPLVSGKISDNHTKSHRENSEPFSKIKEPLKLSDSAFKNNKKSILKLAIKRGLEGNGILSNNTHFAACFKLIFHSCALILREDLESPSPINRLYLLSVVKEEILRNEHVLRNVLD